jgi:hypothetical protein
VQRAGIRGAARCAAFRGGDRAQVPHVAAPPRQGAAHAGSCGPGACRARRGRRLPLRRQHAARDDLFEDISATKSAARRGGRRAKAESGAAAWEVEEAIGVVLSEIDEIAKATFRSITLETMLKLVARRRG